MLQTCGTVNATAQAATLARVLFEDLIVVDIANKLTTIYGNRIEITFNIIHAYTIMIQILLLHHLFTDQFYYYLSLYA
jgi:hypothetical protein